MRTAELLIEAYDNPFTDEIKRQVRTALQIRLGINEDDDVVIDRFAEQGGAYITMTIPKEDRGNREDEQFFMRIAALAVRKELTEWFGAGWRLSHRLDSPLVLFTAHVKAKP